MTGDSRLILIIAVVWLLIALLYTSTVLPIVSMPIAVRVWGTGGVIFMLLAFAIYLAERRKG